MGRRGGGFVLSRLRRRFGEAGRTGPDVAPCPGNARTLGSPLTGERDRGSWEKNRKSGGWAGHIGVGRTVIGTRNRQHPKCPMAASHISSTNKHHAPTNQIETEMLRLLAATTFLAIATHTASATTPPQVTAGPSLLVCGWKLHTACSGRKILALFATPLAPRMGENLRSVAFQPRDGTWRSYGCRSSCPETAASAYESAMGFAPGTLSATLATNWDFLPETDAGSNGIDRLFLGVPEGHPAAGLVETSEDARPILALLAAAGDTAADAPMFRNTESRDRFLDAAKLGLELELQTEGSGLNELALAVKEVAIEPQPEECLEFIVESPSWVSGCGGGWTLTETTEQEITGANCIVVNVWHAATSQTEMRMVRKYYNDCTSCLVTQRRLRLGTGDLRSFDPNASCPLPASPPAPAYTPPAPVPSDPCALPNISWGSWSPWAPPAPGEPGSACP